MTDHALLLANLGSPSSTSVEDVRTQPVPHGPLRHRPAVAAASPAGLADPDQAPGAVGPCLRLHLVARRLAAGRSQPPPAGRHPAVLAPRAGGPGDALRRALHREHPAGTCAPGCQARDAGTAVPAVRRQHHHHRRAGDAPGHRRPRPQASGAGARPLLRPARVPRCPGGQRPPAPGAGLRSPLDELPRAARAPPAQGRHQWQPLPEGRGLLPACRGPGARPLLPRPVLPHQRRLRRAPGVAAGAVVGVFQSRLGRAKWIEPYTETRLDELAAQG